MPYGAVVLVPLMLTEMLPLGAAVVGRPVDPTNVEVALAELDGAALADADVVAFTVTTAL